MNDALRRRRALPGLSVIPHDAVENILPDRLLPHRERRAQAWDAHRRPPGPPRRGPRQIGAALLALQMLCALAVHGQASPRSGPARAGRAGTSSAPEGPLRWSETLARQGNTAGSTLQGVQAQVEHFFRVPGSRVAGDARLVLPLTFDFVGYQRASLQIVVNGVPRRTLPLVGRADSLRLVLPLAPADLRGRQFVQLSLRLAAAISQDVCYDQRVATGFVRLAPEAGLEMQLVPTIARSIALTWQLFPDTVTLDLPTRPLTAAELQAAWTLATLLRADNRTVRVARTAILDAAYDARGLDAVAIALGALDAGGHIGLVSSRRDGGHQAGGRLYASSRSAVPALLLLDSLPASAALLGAALRPALSGSTVGAAITPSGGPARGDRARSFDELGVGTLHREITDRAEWTIPFDTRSMPPGNLPSELGLDLVASPGPNDRPDLLTVFLNDVLIRSMRLTASGRPRRYAIPFPAHLLNTENRLRILVQREGGSTRCEQAPAPRSVQLLGTSVIQGTAAGMPANFLAVPAAMRGGFSMYVSPSIAASPDAAIPLMAALGTTVLPMEALRSVRLVSDAGAANVSGPFVLLDVEPTAGVTAPIVFDRGRVHLVDTEGQRVFDIAGLTSTLLQLVRTADAPGLAILPLGPTPTAPGVLRLAHGNVAFVSETGVDVALQTDRDQTVRIHYADEQSWTDVVARYRYWLLLVALAMTTWGLVFLLKQVYRYRAR